MTLDGDEEIVSWVKGASWWEADFGKEGRAGLSEEVTLPRDPSEVWQSGEEGFSLGNSSDAKTPKTEIWPGRVV